MSERLHIVMPCARPENIPALAQAYLEGMEPHPFEVRWHILQQGPEPDPKGVNKTNEAIDSIRDGWLFLLADDTAQHPALFRRLGELIAENPRAGVVLFGQFRGKMTLIPSPENVRPGWVCGGQAAYRRSFLGDHRFRQEDEHLADGKLLERLWRTDRSRFVFCPEVLMWFGSLEWEKPMEMDEVERLMGH